MTSEGPSLQIIKIIDSTDRYCKRCGVPNDTLMHYIQSYVYTISGTTMIMPLVYIMAAGVPVGNPATKVKY